MDAFESLVAEIHRENPEMVVICGRRILTDKYFPMINKFGRTANSSPVS